VKKTYKKIEEKLTSEGAELRQRVAELKALETAHKQAEQPLGKAEEDKLAILNSISELVVLQDLEHRMVWTNKAAAESVGLTAAQLVGKYCYEIWPQRSQPCVGCPVTKARQTGKPQKAEITIPDGKTWSIRGYPVLDANDCVVGAVELALDITDRKKAEQALADEATRRRILVDQSLDGIVILDDNAKVYEANQQFAEMLGYTPEEIRELHTWDWDIQWSREELLEMGRKVDETGFHLETCHRRKDGSTIDVEISVNGTVIAGQKLIFCVCHDITERKRAEEKLNESEERFRIASQIASDVVYERDLQTGIATFYGDIDSHFGYEPGEYPRTMEGWREHVHPEDLAWIDSQSIYQMEPGVPHSIEYRMRKKDGTYMTWLDKVTVICDEKTGKPLKFLGAATDITERKKAEEALRDSEEKSRKMFESVSCGISVVDLNGTITEVNQRTVEIHGFSSKDEILGKNAFDIVTPRDRDKIAKNMRQALKRSTVRDQEYTLLKSDGSEFPAELSTSVLQDASGKAIGHITISRDITERKQAEEALQSEKNKLQSLIDALEDNLGIQDKHYNIIYQNKPSKANFGDRLGEKCYRAYEGRDKICDDCPVEKAYKDSKSHTSEREVVTPSGEVIFWETTANPIRDARGEIVACIEVGRNVTERKRSEEREKELQKELLLSSRLASIGELAAGVAHQINNPLTGVLGFSQRLLKKSTDQETKQDLKRIYTEAERAAKVVHNLLTFARRRQPHKQYSDINEILESALELQAYELKTSNIEVITRLAPNLPQIMVDFYQIQEVFLNIILNAEQAMTEANSGGKLTIKTEERKGHIRTTFTDNGPGIPTEHLDKIFDPFYTTKGEKGGTGLGLSVCHGIITEHGGKIYARSKPGKGATFFVELPLAHN